MINPSLHAIAAALRRARYFVFVALGLVLAGCQGTVTSDLAIEASANSGTQQVLTNIAGLEFLTEDGATQTLTFSDAEAVELTNYATGAPFRLFTTTELPEGTYTGVRLLFDEDDDEIGSIIDASGVEFPVSLTDGDYATVAFSVEKDKTSRESLTLTLDLRQSLSFDGDDDLFTLKPVLRATDTEEAGQIEGVVNVDCSATLSLNETAAVYLFQGHDVTPDDRDVDTKPYATAPVTFSSNGATFLYTFRFLPEGDYTIALACKGNEEDPTDDDDLDFRIAANVELGEREALVHNITR